MVTLVREVSGNAAQFYTYEACKRHLFGPTSHFADYQLRHSCEEDLPATKAGPDPGVLAGWQAMVCGGIAGFNAWLFSYGADIVKTKIQCENYGFYKRRFFDGGAIEVARQIYKANGIRGFFLGFNAIMGRAIIGNAFGFWGWETSKQLISLDWLASAQKH